MTGQNPYETEASMMGGAYGQEQSPMAAMMSAPQSNISYLDLFQAMLGETGGDWSKAMQVTKFLAPQLGVRDMSQESNKQSKDAMAFQVAQGLVDEVRDMTGNLKLGNNSVMEKLKAPFKKFLGSRGFDESSALYESQRPSMVARMARAMGEVGPLTEYDLARYSALLPTYGDTRDMSEQKIQRLSDRLSRAASVFGGQLLELPQQGAAAQQPVMDGAYEDTGLEGFY